jgi:hypothetical protein
MGDMSLADFDSELQARGFDGFDATHRYRYVQWGYREVMRLAQWETFVGVHPIELTLGQYLIPLSDIPEFSVLASIISATEEMRLQPLYDWDFADYWVPRDFTDSGEWSEPQYYYMYNGSVWILPPTNINRTFRLYYYKSGEALDTVDPSSSTPASPVEFDPAILSAALVYCHRRANQWDLALAEEATRDQLINEYLYTQEFQMLDRQEYFKIPDPYWANMVSSDYAY